jgi:hypothetical protein
VNFYKLENKMRISKKLAGLALIVATASACAGNGNDPSNNDLDVGGVWTGAVTRVQTTCPATADATTLNFTHTVNQNQQAVILDTADGTRFLGNVVGGTGFSVDATLSGQLGNANCSLAENIQYDRISDNSDDTADVDFTITRQCSNGTNCKATYTGAATRNQGNPSVTPVPGATTIPTSGGCGAIPERSFDGDGGCGISTVAVAQNSGTTTLVLDPFGANGATAFVTNAANTSTATSVRSDLVIKTVAGYSCTLTCSPPLTFTASCFKEGGTTCKEKF